MMMTIALILGGLLVFAVIGFAFSISRSAGKYDEESERIARSVEDYDAACEGALIAELSDIRFGSGK